MWVFTMSLRIFPFSSGRGHARRVLKMRKELKNFLNFSSDSTHVLV